MHRSVLAAGIFSIFGIFAGAGQVFPTIGEIYDFEPGDVFEAANYYCCNEVFFQVERREVEEKIFIDNHYGYLTKLSQFNLLREDPHKVVDTSLWKEPDTVWIAYPDSVVFRPGDTVVQNPGFYNGREIYIRKYVLLNALCEERYVKGCGMVYKGWGTLPPGTTTPEDSLTWYCKADECWGNSMLVLRTSPLTDRFRIYPNPVSQVLRISKNSSTGIQAIRLMDLNGSTIRVLKEYSALNNIRIKIPVDDLGSGIYFLYIDTDQGPFVQKFVKL